MAFLFCASGSVSSYGAAHAAAAADVPAGPASAATGAPETGDALDEVVVTGSRLVRAGMTSPTPVTSLSTDEITAANPQSLVQGLAQLPALATSTIPSSVGGRTTLGPGSFLNLRGLGPTRNLVLLDGMRVPPSNIAGNVDINLLPQALVSNVQIVTGGASAAYGSDAVAGVTNFMLNTHYTGFKADLNGGDSGEGDGQSVKASIAWGGQFFDNRLHVIASFDWRDSKPAYAENRPWADQHCAVIPIPGVTAATESAANPRQTLACNVSQPNSAFGGAITTGPLVTPTQGISFAPGGIPQPFVYGSLRSATSQVGGTGDPAYTGEVVNFYTPLNNRVLFGRIGYDLNDKIEAFAQLTASRTSSSYAQTPPYFNGSDPLTIYSGNPFIPATIQTRMTTLGVPSFALGITPTSWGNIQAEPEEQAYDGLLGLKGKFSGSWNWDVHVEHGRTQFREQYTNDVSLANLYRAVDAVVDPATGTTVCRVSLTNPSAANSRCSAINPFGFGSASPAALAYIHGTATEWNVVTQTDAAANLSGELFSTWAGPVSSGIGIEWRRLEGVQSSDSISHSAIDFTGVRGVATQWLNQVGGWATTNVLPYNGSFDVTEGYLEILVPLAKDLPFARSLELNAAGRGTGYSQSGTVRTWKAGLTWRPIDELLVRATRSRDIRAPGISDLYSPVSYSPNVNVTDVSGTATSVPTGLLGNSTLVPETANTFTGGLTYQPAWLSGFDASVDYYDIKIADVIASVSAQDTIDRCRLGEQQFCSNLVRGPAGNLVLILLPQENLNQARTRGLDFDLGYKFAIGAGRLSLRTIATRLLEQSTTSKSATGTVFADRAGDISLGSPHWLVDGFMNYDLGGFGANLVARFISSGPYNATYSAGDLASPYRTVASNLTFNIGSHYRLDSLPGKPDFYFNVQNLLNKAPPLVPGNSLIGFQTNSTLYDTMGRYFTAGLRVAF
jgi:iron complex outermembrane recepter protein